MSRQNDTTDPERVPDVHADAEQLTSAVLTASRLLVAVSAHSLAEVEEALTLPQFRALVVLASRGPMKLVGLAAQLGVNPSTATRMADRLESAGMIDRRVNPDTRREVVLRLTGEGRQVVDGVTARRRAEIAAIVSRMPAELRGQLVTALRAFTRAGGEPAIPEEAHPLGWE
ncbi:MAG: MarR family winged helix-turn-helix transcriptional regulator [Micromonosporaceae bacterium]